MPNFQYAALKPEYTQKWANMTINQGRVNAIKAAATKIIAGKDRYQGISDTTGVPWYMIGIIHLREGDCNFHTHLHNGDSLNRRTVHVPAGRPLGGTAPFSFEYSAVDALKLEGYDKITDWSIERIAYCFEKFNGFGYRQHGVPSAYLWAGTNQYVSGKYVSDGVFNKNVIDTQLGSMSVLKKILELTNEKPIPVVPVATTDIVVPPTSPKADLDRPTNADMNQNSLKFRLMGYYHYLFGGVTASGIGLKSIDTADLASTKAMMDTIKEFVVDYGVFLFIAAGIGGTLLTMAIRARMKTDVEEGRSIPSGETEESAS